jgi:hypothetical protein
MNVRQKIPESIILWVDKKSSGLDKQIKEQSYDQPVRAQSEIVMQALRNEKRNIKSRKSHSFIEDQAQPLTKPRYKP